GTKFRAMWVQPPRLHWQTTKTPEAGLMPEFYIITGSTLTNVTCETLVTLGMKNQTCCPNVLDKLWNLIRGQRQVTMAKRLRLIACVVQQPALQLHDDAHGTPQNSMGHFPLSVGKEMQKSDLAKELEDERFGHISGKVTDHRATVTMRTLGMRAKGGALRNSIYIFSAARIKFYLTLQN
ncbi:hypothetical protein U0070_016949, partial [Myodes glareolus]